MNLSKNPVNLSNFIEFYGNSIFSNEAPGFDIIPKSPESARTANAGKCAFRDSPERPPDPCGQHPFRRLKNRRLTGGLSSVPYRREMRVTANAGKCVCEGGGAGNGTRPARLRNISPQAGAKRFLRYLNTLSHSPRTALKLRWAATQSLRPISLTLLRSIRNGRTFAGGV